MHAVVVCSYDRPLRCSHTAAAQCSTARHLVRHYQVGNYAGRDAVRGGYKTGIFGKWHLGHTAGRYPTNQGFDEWYGIANLSDQAFWADSDNFQADASVQLPRIMTALRDQKPQQKEVFDRAKRSTIDREITDHAIVFI